MLVLARQLHERIIMPTVAATIEVVALKAGAVRLGFEAPPEVLILREEVLLRDGISATPAIPAGTDAETRLDQIKQVLRNRLDTLALGLDLLREQLQGTPLPGLTGMLQRMEDEARTLDQQLKTLLADPLEAMPAPDAIVRPARVAEGGLAI